MEYAQSQATANPGQAALFTDLGNLFKNKYGEGVWLVARGLGLLSARREGYGTSCRSG